MGAFYNYNASTTAPLINDIGLVDSLNAFVYHSQPPRQLSPADGCNGNPNNIDDDNLYGEAEFPHIFKSYSSLSQIDQQHFLDFTSRRPRQAAKSGIVLTADLSPNQEFCISYGSRYSLGQEQGSAPLPFQSNNSLQSYHQSDTNEDIDTPEIMLLLHSRRLLNENILAIGGARSDQIL